MKRALIFVVMCFSLSSFAESNFFRCKGDGATLEFSTSSFLGTPSLHLERNGKSLHFQNDKAIQVKRSSDGLNVTAGNRYDHVSFVIPANDTEFSMVVQVRSLPRLFVNQIRVTCEGWFVNF